MSIIRFTESSQANYDPRRPCPASLRGCLSWTVPSCPAAQPLPPGLQPRPGEAHLCHRSPPPQGGEHVLLIRLTPQGRGLDHHLFLPSYHQAGHGESCRVPAHCPRTPGQDWASGPSRLTLVRVFPACTRMKALETQPAQRQAVGAAHRPGRGFPTGQGNYA